MELSSPGNMETSEHYFRSLTDSIPIIVWITNPGGYCIYLNKYWYEYTGQTQQEAEGFGWLTATHPEDRDKAREIFIKANEEQKSFTLFYRLLNKNGEYRWAMDYGSPKFASDGSFEGMSGTVVDIHDQKLAEEELRKTSRHLQIATVSAAVGTWSLDLKTETLEWSGLHKKLWGYDENRSDLIYADWYTVILAEDKDDAFAQVEFARINRTQYENVYRIKRINDGAIRYMRSIGQYFYDKDGTPYMLTGITIDITEQKEAEEALQYRKALLEAQNEAIPDAILVVDMKGTMLSFNRHFATLWNIPEEVIQKKDDTAALAFAMTQVVDPQHFIDRVNYCYAHPDENTYEEVMFKDGRVLERYGNAIIGENGVQYGWIWYFRDITHRKNAERILRESEERFRLLADGMPQFVWTGDAEGNLGYFNQAVYDYTGLSKETIANEGWIQIVHPEDREENIRLWLHSVATGEPFLCEHRFKRFDGTYRWQLSRATPQKNAKGNIQQWIGTSTDIHDKKNIEEQLESLVAARTQELQRSNEDLQQFAHVASHDLKEPVRKVETFINRLEQHLASSLDETAVRFIEKIRIATNRMNAMIDGVLRYSTINAYEQAPQNVDLNTVIKNIETDLEVRIQNTGATISYSQLPTIQGAEILLYQLFYNLITNSIKFSKHDTPPNIRINSRIVEHENKQVAEMIFSDNGIGFENKYGKIIFNTFTRLNSKAQYEGTGLGLSLCKKIIERHGGTITAKGIPDEGARFIITLPLI